MPKKIIDNLDHPRDITPAALQFLTHDGFQRLDGECVWHLFEEENKEENHD